MEFIRTNKGNAKLCYENHMYIKKKEHSDGIRWECVRRRRNTCRATLKTGLDMENAVVSGLHNHNSSAASVTVEKVRQTLKTRAAEAHERPKQIVAAELRELGQEEMARLGNLNTVKRDVQRQQRKHNQHVEPENWREFNIPEEWKTTGTGNPRQFLIHDSGTYGNGRVVVYGSDDCLRVLARADIWLMDGNFKMAPRIFEQLYIIRAPLGTSAVTCIFAFLTGKTQLLYEEMLQAILNRCGELGFQPDPQVVITDFEQTVFNAVRHVLGEHVDWHGCFYHLTQSMWCKIQELGLTNVYRENDEIQHFCGMIDGLAFLPVDNIEEGLGHLRGRVPEALEPLLNYFDATYVSGTYRRIQRPPGPGDDGNPAIVVRHIPPRFPPTLWNVRAITMDGGNRTNNFCEAWNIGYRSLVGHHHPSMWNSIEAIRKEEAFALADIVNDERGNPPTKRVKYATLELQRRLRNLCDDHEQGRKNMIEFLAGIGHCIRLL